MSMKILFRIDGDERIGAGHVLRSLALTQRLVERGITVEFVCRRLSPGLAAKVEAAGFTIHRVAGNADAADDCRQLLKIAEVRNAAWIVLDGYEFSADYRQAAYQSGRQLLLVDDLGRDDLYHADILVNSVPDAGQITYRCPPGTTLLLGPSYAPVATEFCELRTTRVATARAGKLLATFGGSDPADFSTHFLKTLALLRRSDLEVRLIVGPANPRYEALRQLRDKLGIVCEVVVNPPSMAQEMTWADLAITAAGSTCWELATLGVPCLLIVTAENQVPLATGLDRHGAVVLLRSVHLGWGHAIESDLLAREIASLLDDSAQREQMSFRARELVDGRGPLRIHQAVLEATIELCPVQSEDARLLFDWVNDPQTRASSFSSGPIDWDAHCRWLEERLRDRSTGAFWLARDAHGVALGQVRYDLHEGESLEAVVSISVAAEYRGRGVGRRLLQISARRLFAERGIRRLHAFVRPENEASCRALTAAGYVEMATRTLRGQPARHFTLGRE